MRMLIKKILGVVIFIVYLLMVGFISCYFHKLGNLITGQYPALGDYYIQFGVNEEDDVVAMVTYEQEIYWDEVIDLSNLELYIREGARYYLDKEAIYNDWEIRKALLEYGVVKIINEEIASSEEIACQSKAMKSENGLWRVEGNGTIGETLHSFFYKVLLFIESRFMSIVAWILGTLIGIGTILEIIVKIMSYKKIETILMGSMASGKTTVIKRMSMPNISEGKLKVEATPTKAEEIVKCDRIAYKNKDIHPYYYDYKGDDFGKMIDAVNKKGVTRSGNRVIVYVVSFTHLNEKAEFDYEIVNSQISKATVVAKSFKTSTTLGKTQKIIVFLNKCDLLYETEEEFLSNYDSIEELYKKTLDYCELQQYADAIIFGSALKNWGIEELKQEIISR